MAGIPPQIQVTRPLAIQAARRSQFYGLLGQGVSFPTLEIYDSIHEGAFLQRLQGCASSLPYSLAVGEDFSLGGADLVSFQAAYLSLFEIGGKSGPPASLYEGHYCVGRGQVMSEVMSFYHHFGLQLAEGAGRDLPDHLATEMEFMHLLAFREAVAAEAGNGVEPYASAQQDFLKLHLAIFLPTIAKRLPPSEIAFFPALVNSTSRFCDAERAYLSSTKT